MPELLQEFLAKLFGVPLDRVFVGAESEMGNWDQAAVDRSLVSSSYEARSGALAWYLSGLRGPGSPSAAAIGGGVVTATFLRAQHRDALPRRYPDSRRLPFVTSEGTLGLTRFNGDDTDICEVSRPVPEFPAAAVARFEDEVWDTPFPHPVTLRYFPTDPDGGPLGTVRDRLRIWEALTVRMAGNWPPLGWYGASLYVMDLDFRDEVTTLLRQLAEPDRDTAQTVLDLLDAAYHDLTVDDGGAALIAAGVLTPQEMAGKPWYWRRRPHTLPW